MKTDGVQPKTEPAGVDRFAHDLFLVSLFAKGALGVVQLFTAGAIVFGVADRLPAIAHWLVRAELSEDPGDFIASHFIALAQHLPGTDLTFYAVYFAAHGLLHLGLVISLLRKISWAYPAAIAVLTGFIAFQVTEWVSTHSTMLIVLSAIDLLVIGLTAHEWRVRGRRHRMLQPVENTASAGTDEEFSR